jgi:hypothetical protein
LKWKPIIVSADSVREVEYEAFSRSRYCRFDDRRGGFNAGIGISVSGPQF